MRLGQPLVCHGDGSGALVKLPRRQVNCASGSPAEAQQPHPNKIKAISAFNVAIRASGMLRAIRSPRDLHVLNVCVGSAPILSTASLLSSNHHVSSNFPNRRQLLLAQFKVNWGLALLPTSSAIAHYRSTCHIKSSASHKNLRQRKACLHLVSFMARPASFPKPCTHPSPIYTTFGGVVPRLPFKFTPPSRAVALAMYSLNKTTCPLDFVTNW